MRIEHKIATMGGVSKRLFMALSDFRGKPPQLEDALFQLSAVIDATAQLHHPNEKSRSRFINYTESIMTGVFRIVTSGRVTMTECKFETVNSEPRTFGEIMWKIRNASYHNPNELDDLIYWGNNTHIGHKDGKFTIDQNLLVALFLMLISDEKNQGIIGMDIFDDHHPLIINENSYPISDFVGNRLKLFEVLGYDQFSDYKPSAP